MREGRHGGRWGAGLVMGLAAVLALAGCSDTRYTGTDPVDWMRGLVGLSAHDAQDQTSSNSQNLKEGSKEPYPNLASVPTPPETAMSRIDRKKLAQSLIADRRNAEYTDQQLRPGENLSALPPPAPSPASVAATPIPAKKKPERMASRTSPHLPKRGSAKPPMESSLVSPTIANPPRGEMAEAAPPAPPGIRRHEQLAAAMPPPAEAMARARPAAGLVAEIRFNGEPFRTGIVPADEAELAGVARRALQQNARIRIIGHGGAAAQGDLAEREFQSFDAALDNAKAVAVALTRLGVPADRIDVETAANVDSSNRADIYLED